jgi:uncharacterized protein
MAKNDTITPVKLSKYFSVSRSAFQKASDAVNKDRKSDAAIILDMSGRYISDAEFFRKNGDFINAFAALNYAHGWLDTGSKLGIFDVTDSDLFVVK